MEFSRPEYWSGQPFHSPGDLPTQGSNPGLPHCRRILYPLSHKGSPKALYLHSNLIRPTMFHRTSLMVQMVRRLAYDRPGFDPWVGKILWRRKWQPTPVPLPGKSHGWRSVVDYSPWGHKESDTTERLHDFTFLSCKMDAKLPTSAQNYCEH